MGAVAKAIDRLNLVVGRGVAWLALLMVLIQFGVVVARYVFNVGNIAVQESIWYLHGIIFMMGAGYTLLYGGHVRVDIFYREASERRRALVDLFGVLVFLLPICVTTFVLSWSYVLNSWAVLEGSTEVAGLPFIYLLKTVIWIFAALVGLQGLSIAIKAIAYLSGASPSYRPSPFGEAETG